MNEADRAAFKRVEDGEALALWRRLLRLLHVGGRQIDLVIETEIKPYDIMPLIPVITGAGGTVTTWENGPAQDGGRIVVAGDARVHKAALEMLNK